jgi:hypothetical protein
MRKARGVNLDYKSGAGIPKAVWRCLQRLSGYSRGVVDTKMYCFCLSLGPISCVERGSLLHGQQLTLHTNRPGLCPGEDTPASPHSVDTTREAVDTGYKLSAQLASSWRQGLLPTVGEMSMSHWTTTARLKLGSPQSIRCCPATVCLPYWVRRAQGTRMPDK